MAMLEEYCKACGIKADTEVLEIDQMEAALTPLDSNTVQIRLLISSFELCYHEADKEAEYIVQAIGNGRCPPRSNERPAQRKQELEACRQILTSWCKDPTVRGIDVELGGISADELMSYIGTPTILKTWQVHRVLDKVVQALDRSRPYHNIVLDLGPHGEPGGNPIGDYYQDNLDFVQKTVNTIIHDTIAGQKATISLALAIDTLEPCNWDFVGSAITILKAIGGDLHPARPYACHQRNLELSPLRAQMITLSKTLRAYWKTENQTEDIIPERYDSVRVIDENMLSIKDIPREQADKLMGGGYNNEVLATLGKITPVKRWLAASLDKTIRLYLEVASGFWLMSFPS